MVFNEGAKWAKRRKIITTVFNFDFLNEMIPKIIDVAQQTFKDSFKDQTADRLETLELA